jgi:hypothetical protein
MRNQRPDDPEGLGSSATCLTIERPFGTLRDGKGVDP